MGDRRSGRPCASLTAMKASFHVPAQSRRTALVAVAVVMYAVTLQFAYSTAGDPYRFAVAEAERLEAEKNASVANGTLNAPFSGAASAMDLESLEEDDADIEEGAFNADDPFGSLLPVVGNVTFVEANETDTNTTANSGRPLPSPYLPSALATFALFSAVVLHALFHLLCHWLFWFRAAALFSVTTKVDAGVSVLMQPPTNHGKADLCTVSRSSRTNRLVFTFQRQLYEIVHLSSKNGEPQEEDESCKSGFSEPDNANPLIPVLNTGGDYAVRLVAYPVAERVKHYVRHGGLGGRATGGNDDVISRLGHYGNNSMTIAAPKFFDLLKQQLLSPVSMFQIFTSILWMLDEYWQYVIFQIIMIVMLDCVTAFQRKRTMSTLDGMAAKPYPVHVLRNGSWAELSSEDLLPGDLFSLKWAVPPANAQGKEGQGTDSQKKNEDGSLVGELQSLANARANEPGSSAPPAPSGTSTTGAIGVNMNIVPCDCLLLRGAAVTNEATLTGESVPQMKDALTEGVSSQDGGAPSSEAERSLALDSIDRVHVLFSGTALVNSTSGDLQKTTGAAAS